MTHRSQVVDFVWLDLRNNGNEICCVTQVTVMQVKLYTGLMTIFVDVIDTARIERRGTTDDSVYLEKRETIVRKLVAINYYLIILAAAYQLTV